MERICENCGRLQCPRRANGIVCRNFKEAQAPKKPVSIYEYAKGCFMGKVSVIRVTDTQKIEDLTVYTTYDVPVIDYMLPGMRSERISYAPNLTGGVKPVLPNGEVMDDSWMPVLVSRECEENLDPMQLANNGFQLFLLL